MKFADYDIVFKEHPNHVSLLFRITGCPNHCKNCHSSELHGNSGEELTIPRFIDILQRYHGLFTNVIFFGGEWESDHLCKLLEICRCKGIRTTLWSGCAEIAPKILGLLDYVKTGEYDEQKGGLDSPRTNQKYIEVSTGRQIEIRW
jgi:anaerobic ribonucleoside-triphosphate reductase activating protein